MNEGDLYQLLGFLRVSPYRQKIVQHLYEISEPQTPTDIAEVTGLQRNHVSSNLSKLKQKNLVAVLNPEASNHRYYQLTEKGQALIEQAKEDDIIDWLES